MYLHMYCPPTFYFDITYGVKINVMSNTLWSVHDALRLNNSYSHVIFFVNVVQSQIPPSNIGLGTVKYITKLIESH